MRLIYSIGHSTRSQKEFIDILTTFSIEVLADIRRYPYSPRNPHFNSEHLSQALREMNIEYIHIEELGGRRKLTNPSKSSYWRNSSFKAYQQYMETEEFQLGIEKLTKHAVSKLTAYMCSELLYWKCHRWLVSDHMLYKGWNVQHILNSEKTVVHKFSPGWTNDTQLSLL